MLYASDLPDGSPGGALWHIFASATTATLREFLRREPEVGFEGPGDPIHNQKTYLTPSLLQLLAKKYGVYPYIIQQRTGDTVYIPAGCPHQVGIQA